LYIASYGLHKEKTQNIYNTIYDHKTSRIEKRAIKREFPGYIPEDSRKPIIKKKDTDYTFSSPPDNGKYCW
jgi:hypothetical protein